MAACVMCARSKALHRPPAGLLYPLPVPSRPWSHIPVDLVTGLPPSNGHTVILTIVDRFPKMVHYVPLSKLPFTTETADLLPMHVFRIHGFQTNIVWTKVSSSHPGSGRCSAKLLAPPAALTLVTTPSLMDRQRELTRIWRLLCAESQPKTLPPGPPGNIHITC